MPSDARWRRIKIVVPLAPTREQELSGGLKNAIDRGETLAKAKQTFISAGYKPEEIQAAVRKVSSLAQPIRKPLAQTPQQPTPTPQKLSKKFIIILSIIAVSILIIAVVLGLFWDTIF
ncbi:hypothetical protein KAT36_03180 [Candidatus Pacearchaeota archaeon]|nr:hypothetical protein [Candidatus Pacearchaeota archaeon]